MLVQQYSLYTEADHHVWQLLYSRQMQAIQQAAYQQFFKNTAFLGFTEEHIPAFTSMNARLKNSTGWEIYAVPGLIANDLFFKQLHQQKFGASTWIRKMEELDYLEEPDMFHDIFGHLPQLADPLIANFLLQLASVAVKHLHKEEVLEAIARLYWYTIEFGLVQEKDEVKIYGAGLLSSIAETKFCLSAQANRIPFDVEQVLSTPYIKDKFQEQYFVLDTMEQLTASIPALVTFANRFFEK